MNAGGTSERVYQELKRRILAREFRPGARLDPAILCETMHSSVTPVRDCLNTLCGEGLVETRASEGFHLPHVELPGLQDLYAWNAEILMLGIKAWRTPTASTDPGRPVSPDPVALVNATTDLFTEICARSANIEHRRAIASVSDRLHAARLAECHVLPDVWDEFTALQHMVGRGDIAGLRRSLAHYHRRRFRSADAVVRALYRNGEKR